MSRRGHTIEQLGEALDAAVRWSEYNERTAAAYAKTAAEFRETGMPQAAKVFDRYQGNMEENASNRRRDRGDLLAQGLRAEGIGL